MELLYNKINAIVNEKEKAGLSYEKKEMVLRIDGCAADCRLRRRRRGESEAG